MTPEPLRILLVADDPDQIRRVGLGLKRQAEARTVLEGADSLATARRRVSAGTYDVALLDLGLGEGAGPDLLAGFRSVAPGVPVVVLAGDAADLVACLAAGAADGLSPEAVDCAGLVDRLAAAAARARVGAEAALREARTGAALEAAGDLLWHWSPAGPVWLSAADPGAWGLSESESGLDLEAARERIHPDDRERAAKKLREALEGEGALRIEARLRLGSGGYRWCECRGRVRRNPAGVLEHVAGVVTDVQRRHNSLRDLERARRRLRAVLDSDPVPQALVDPSGLVVDCNKAWMAFDEAGCRAGGRFGPGTDFLAADDGEPRPGRLSAGELGRGLRQVLGGVIGQFSCEYGAGEHRWRIRIFPLLSPGIAGAIVRHEDLSAERRAAAGAAERLAGLEASLAALPAPWFRLAQDFTVLEAGAEAAALCGADPAGRDVLKALPRQDAEAAGAALAAAGRGEGPGWRDAAGGEGRAARRWGAGPIPGGEGLDGFLLFAVDIADLSARDAELEAARDAAVASPAGLALVEHKDGETLIRWANPAFAALSGQAADGLAGRRLADHLAGAGRWDEAELERVLAGPGAAGSLAVHRYDGAAWDLAFARAGRYTCIAAADVAERERSAAALGEVRRRLQAVLRGSGDGAWEWDDSAGSGWLSPRAVEVLGLSEQAAGEGFEAAVRRVHRADRAGLRSALQRAAAEGGRVDAEVRLETPAGCWVEVRGEAVRGSHLVAGTVRDVSDARRAREALEARERRVLLALHGAGLGTWSWSGRTGRVKADAAARRLHGVDGEAGRAGLRSWLARVAPEDRRRVLEAVSRPPADGRLRIEYGLAGGDLRVALEGQVAGGEDGSPRRAEGVCRDATDRAAAAGAAEAARAARDLAGLAGVAAGELNNLLGVVLGSLELLEANLSDGAGAARRIAAAAAAARQAGRVAGRLADAAGERRAAPAPAADAGQAGAPAEPVRSLLVVESDPGLRGTAAELAASLGWRVRSAADAEAALAALDREPADVLLAEFEPAGGKDGRDLAARAVALVPGLRVVFCANRALGADAAGYRVVTKPYGRKELAAALDD